MILKHPSVWHRRLIHINNDSVGRAHQYSKDVPRLTGDLKRCHPCVQGKQTKKSFKSKFEEATHAGEITHSDLSQPGVTSINGAKYMCTFLDQYSRFVTIATIQQKSQTNQAYEEFKSSYVSKWFKVGVTKTHTDGGGE